MKKLAVLSSRPEDTWEQVPLNDHLLSKTAPPPNPGRPQPKALGVRPPTFVQVLDFAVHAAVAIGKVAGAEIAQRLVPSDIAHAF